MCFIEQQRENDRALRKAGRDVERDRRELEREEKKIVSMLIGETGFFFHLHFCKY